MIKSTKRYTHKGKLKRIISYFIFFILIICIVVVFILNKSNIEKFLGLNKQLINSGQEIYALKYDSFDNYEKAYSSGMELQSIGGAGFIRRNGDKYDVYISSYPEREQAEKVQQNLSAQNVICEIENITLKNFVLRTIRADDELKECLSGHIRIYNSLYEVFENYISNPSEVVARQKLNNIYSDFNILYRRAFNESKETELLICKLYVGNLLEILDNIVSLRSEYIWSIQYTMFKVIYDYQNMIEALNY